MTQPAEPHSAAYAEAEFAAQPDMAAGTPESAWQRWFARSPAPPVADFTECPRLVVISAHPDDEVLGAGGLMRGAAASGVHVSVVCLSDGAASHPGSPTHSALELAQIRRQELVAATATLGVTDVSCAGLPDGKLHRYRDQIESVVTTAIGENPNGTTVLSVYDQDGHPDHDAAGIATRAAVQRIQRNEVTAGNRGLTFAMYPIWMWHWATPGGPNIDWPSLRRLRLDPRDRQRKILAVNSFRSQIADLSAAPADRRILTAEVLSRLLREDEYFFFPSM